MVIMKLNNYVVLILLLLVPRIVFAEVSIDSSITGTITGGGTSIENFDQDIITKGVINIKSANSRNVRGQLSIDGTVSEKITLLDISKAWVKFRFTNFIGTIGKNRISWGDGIAFNAGDVIFDDYLGNNIDLTQNELRSVNRVLALGYFPLGLYTFIEAIYMPSDLDFKTHSGGGRFHTIILEHKVETGYIYNGQTYSHKPYVSFNGTGIVNYHLSASLNFQDVSKKWKDNLKISGGVFIPIDVGDQGNLSLRLEAMVKPFEEYKYQIYPEVFYSISSEISFFLRSLIDIDKNNSSSTIGVSWRTFPGFTISGFGLFATGDINSASYGISVNYLF